MKLQILLLSILISIVSTFPTPDEEVSPIKAATIGEIGDAVNIETFIKDDAALPTTPVVKLEDAKEELTQATTKLEKTILPVNIPDAELPPISPDIKKDNKKEDVATDKIKFIATEKVQPSKEEKIETKTETETKTEEKHDDNKETNTQTTAADNLKPSAELVPTGTEGPVPSAEHTTEVKVEKNLPNSPMVKNSETPQKQVEIPAPQPAETYAAPSKIGDIPNRSSEEGASSEEDKKSKTEHKHKHDEHKKKNAMSKKHEDNSAESDESNESGENKKKP